MERDPIKDPQPGDIVQGVWTARNPLRHAGEPGLITCEAVCGNLIAISSDYKRDPDWIRREDWCKADVWIKEYKVIHAAAPAKEGA